MTRRSLPISPARRALLAGAALLPLAAAAEPAAVLLVGDSTMAARTGYGQALCARLEPATACLNLARGGRSTLSYRAEGLWDALIAQLKAGPAGAAGAARYVLIQFGHNDQPGKPGRNGTNGTDGTDGEDGQDGQFERGAAPAGRRQREPAARAHGIAP